MKNNDVKTREEIRVELQMALKNNDTEKFYQAFDEMIECVANDVRQEYEEKINHIRQEMDSRILAARGVRQLTSDERTYYQKMAEAMKSRDPKQAMANLDVVMPETIIDSVFDELQEDHPLLSHINFVPSGGAVKMIMNTNGHQEAAWGQLCDEIVKELTSGFKEVDTVLLKLSAFLPVCKAMLDLGPEWLDNYIRQVLYEALANGMEVGIVTGDGNEKPIGMNRQVGDNVTVTGGVYPKKTKISVSDLMPTTLGNLLSLLAVDENGKSRKVNDLIMIVNPQDYFKKIMPATTLMAPDGSYRNDVLPYPITIIQSAAVDQDEAILGIGSRYFAAAGTSKEGKIEYSDHYRFVEDERVYLIKAYANGMPMDNNAFLYLDISGLRPATWKVEQVTTPAASANAMLTDLKIGNLTLSPKFDAETITYTATTSNAKNTIIALPADAAAAVEVKLGDDKKDNGEAVEWATGSNVVKVTVTAADGKTTKTYTVTVTKQ